MMVFMLHLHLPVFSQISSDEQTKTRMSLQDKDIMSCKGLIARKRRVVRDSRFLNFVKSSSLSVSLSLSHSYSSAAHIRNTSFKILFQIFLYFQSFSNFWFQAILWPSRQLLLLIVRLAWSLSSFLVSCY